VLILTMTINVFSAPIVALMFAMLRSCSRCKDRGCTNDMTKTKKVTQKDWIALYIGPEFLIDMRYS